MPKLNHNKFIHDLYQGFLHRDPEPGAVEHWEAQINSGMGVDRLVEVFLQSDEFQAVQRKVQNLFVSPGHFYSPIVNTDDVQVLFTHKPVVEALPALAVDKDAQLKMWRKLLPYLQDIPFPQEKTEGFRYHFDNPAFSYGDGSILHAMLRAHQPKRLVEVGSGYSSACAIDTIDRFLGGEVQVSFVEPYPQLLVDLLGQETADRFDIHPSGVQETDLALFQTLESGDFLFIDSTHVMKTGSDVCHELFNILPALKPGVFIHFHDIFWPFEYGREWVLEQNRSWNEIYGLRAFLMYNDAFEIVFFNDFFVQTCRNVIQQDYPAMLKNSGGSIWLRKKL
jgi:hypothetical protein